jgi:hypothetical protein
VEFEPNRRIVRRTIGGIERTFHSTFDAQDRKTRLTVAIECKAPVPVLGGLAEGVISKLIERESDTLVANIKDRVEA